METSDDGAFKRKDSTYRSWIGKEFPAEGIQDSLVCRLCIVETRSWSLMMVFMLQLGGTTCTFPLHAHGHADA